MKHALSMKSYYRELLSAQMQGAKQLLAIGFWHWWNDHNYRQKPGHDETPPLSWTQQSWMLDSWGGEKPHELLGLFWGRGSLPWGTKETCATGRRSKKETAKVVQAQGNGPRRQGKAGRQSGDAGRERKRLHLINSQAMHAGHDFSSSNQAETITLWMQTP